MRLLRWPGESVPTVCESLGSGKTTYFKARN